MGYVFRYEDAERYHEWFQSERGRAAAALEKELLLRLWAPAAPQRVLEVGCGTGIFLDWFAQKGHQVTGLEPSSPMLRIARRHLSDRITLDQGVAEHLPYEDNAFDTVALITTLEFVDDPLLALQEAFRVARRHVLLGVLNKYSLRTWHHYLHRLWSPCVCRHAHFFSVFELNHLVQEALTGSVPLRWRTCLSFPLFALKYLSHLERSRFFTWHPFGHFIAMRVDMAYPFQTIQEPLFSDLSSPLATSFRGSCWRSSDEKRCYNDLILHHFLRRRPSVKLHSL